MRIDELLRLLGKVKRSGDGWLCQCPAHDDQNPSLAVNLGDDHRILIHCHANCSIEAICASIGITQRDLFVDSSEASIRQVIATYPYHDENGLELFRVVRYEPKDFRQQAPNGKWSTKGIRKVLYRLPELVKAPAEFWIFLTEGEKDADRLRSLGLVSTTNPSGAGKFHLADSTPLHGRRVAILTDNDDTGRKHVESCAKLLDGKAVEIRTIALPGLPDKGDVSDWLDAGHTVEELLQIVEQAQNWKPAKSRNSSIQITCLADIEPEAIDWLWEPRIPIGKLTVIAGDPKKGKSLVTMDLAARVSTGRPWPDAPGVTQPIGSVIILSAEDDPADTIRPRLDAAGAEVSKIHFVTAVKRADGALGLFDLERDVYALEEKITQYPDCRLIIIDPITAYCGKTDSHKNADVRRLLAPLADLARRHRIAVVAVTHLSKNSNESKVLYRTMGSLAFTAAARAVWYIAEDDENPKRRFMLLAGMNLAGDTLGLAFSIESRWNEVVKQHVGLVLWEQEPVHVTAMEVMAKKTKQRAKEPTRVDVAADWLRELLSAKPRTQAEIESLAQQNGFSLASVRRAKALLGVLSIKQPGKEGRWLWQLPSSETSEPKVRSDASCHPQLSILDALNPLSTFSAPTLEKVAETEFNGAQGAQPAQDVHVEGTRTNGEHVSIPDGWLPLAWAARLEQQADRMHAIDPEGAMRNREVAKRIRIESKNKNGSKS